MVFEDQQIILLDRTAIIYFSKCLLQDGLLLAYLVKLNHLVSGGSNGDQCDLSDTTKIIRQVLLH